MSISLKTLPVAIVVLAALAAPAASFATPNLHVIGYGSLLPESLYTSAQASQYNVHAMYVRGYGRNLSLEASVGCTPRRQGNPRFGMKRTTIRSMVSGRLYRLRMPFAVANCDVTAGLHASGRVRLEILA